MFKILALVLGLSGLNIDYGGDLITRMQVFEMLENTKVAIPLEGVCISACTMYLGLSKVCVKPNTVFGFHSAYNYNENGEPVKSKFGNSILMQYYPPAIEKWVKDNKAFDSLDLTYMDADTAWKLGIPKCK